MRKVQKQTKQVKCGEEKPHCSRCTRLGVRCPGYVKSLRWVTKHEEQSPGASSEYKATSPAPSSSQAPRRLSASIEDAVSVDIPNPGPTHDEPDAVGFDIDGSVGLCDNLWDLPGSTGNRSLPELTDLCPQAEAVSASGFPEPQDPLIYDFTSTGDTAADLSHFLSLIGPSQDEPVNNGSVYQGFSPSTIIRSYPPAGQRSPRRDVMSISRPLNNPSWTLIEYYFKEVAALFSSYDSQMNPFRTTVSRLWGSSLAMCRTMQSMAAATLVNDFPQFGPMGKKMRDEAVDIITREAVMDDKSLLALLMLGQTASWHDSNDLGIPFFNLLRKQMNSISSGSTPHGIGFNKSASNNYRFFEEALIYWEMLLSFVADNGTMVLSDDTSYVSESLVLQRVPHPWTGIARDTQFTVHEVGRLVRRERKRICSRKFTSQDDITRAQIAMEKARELEDRLLSLAHPTEAEIVSPGDDETPVWHLLTMAEVYRCTGLMQLYRVFPDLLRTRLPNPEESHFSDLADTAQSDPFFPIDLDSMDLSLNFGDTTQGTTSNKNQSTNPHYHSHSPSISSHTINLFPPSEPHHQPPTFVAQESPADSLYDAWLTEFAVTLISRLKTIPLESRTRCLQPLLLVASCSELRLPRSSAGQSNDEFEENQDNTSKQPRSGTETPNVSMETIEVSRTRKFILGRLTSFLHVLPPKPINVCLRLVREVWRRMDAGDTDTYWVDIMIEKGWETTMG
ncbi:transcriptional regulator family: Fungal Specific TF [Penicillium angulare]|uniref:transcriptional regulator family: Fungal Specific TF n=1 Tax=Penicillium angulare TaxID=116970 RepID=UPI00253FCBB7|nr:transcriptional regulator family: Fungal Specific TF [Penicillium angulare]KAJ5266543.1 transcriptional regulator family: Fungal Specific TF [Penicillium angulare]